MQPVEAMQILLGEADIRLQTLEKHGGPENWTPERIERFSVATAVVTAMLNTALPVAKYRCFVEKLDTREDGRNRSEGMMVAEFTVCSVNMRGIKSGLTGLWRHDSEVRILVFEQRATGADVVSGWQGKLGSKSYRDWYRSLPDDIDPETTAH